MSIIEKDVIDLVRLQKLYISGTQKETKEWIVGKNLTLFNWIADLLRGNS